MFIRIKLRGTTPLVMHCGIRGLDTRSPLSREISEIAKKRGTNRTQADDDRLAELECQKSLWLNSQGAVTIPERVIRANIEAGARKLKQGPLVREGLIVVETRFIYDTKVYGKTIEEIGKSAIFQAPVVVQRNRILRTRAKFDTWECDATIEIDPELVDKEMLTTWFDIAGRRIGIGDWRPEKSGHYGRYEMNELSEFKFKK